MTPDIEVDIYRGCLKGLIYRCRDIINDGMTRNGDLNWLNNFCAKFFHATLILHKFMKNYFTDTIGPERDVEFIYVNLLQIVTCTKQLRKTIKAEKLHQTLSSGARRHFIYRIASCIDRIYKHFRNGIDAISDVRALIFENSSFLDLLCCFRQEIEPYSSYNSSQPRAVYLELFRDSRKIRGSVHYLLAHALSLANVALEKDKKALGTLCKKVLRDCAAFQMECARFLVSDRSSEIIIKIKAITLENIILRLENYVNETLLRLIFTCLLGCEKFSIEKVRTIMETCDCDDPALDNIIADFDINVDRMTQIGNFAIGYSKNEKLIAMLRSSLSSFEALDAFLIPILQKTNVPKIYSEILAEHFEDEVWQFRNGILEFVNSYSYVCCYEEIVRNCLNVMYKKYNKIALLEIAQMGDFIVEHFEHQTKKELLSRDILRMKIYQKYELILDECKAILMCAEPIDTTRILKRFQILRSVLEAFAVSLKNVQNNGQGALTQSNETINEDFTFDNEESIINFSMRKFVEPARVLLSKQNIAYKRTQLTRRTRISSCDCKVSYEPASMSISTTRPIPPSTSKARMRNLKFSDEEPSTSVRKEHSLRTAMFKTPKTLQTAEAFEIYKNDNETLEITEILIQLANLSESSTKLHID